MGKGGNEEKIVNIKVEEMLWRRVRAQAALDGKSAYQWVVEAIKEKLNHESKLEVK